MSAGVQMDRIEEIRKRVEAALKHCEILPEGTSDTVFLLDEVARLRGENEFIQRQLNDLRQDAIREFLYASPKYVQCRKENDTLRRQLEVAIRFISAIENVTLEVDTQSRARDAIRQIEAIGKE